MEHDELEKNHTSRDTHDETGRVARLREGGQYLDFKNPTAKFIFTLASFVFFIIAGTLRGYRYGREDVREIVVETIPQFIKPVDDRVSSLSADYGVLQLQTKTNTEEITRLRNGRK